MPTYCTHDDLWNRLYGNEEVSYPDDEDVVEALLERAEKRVDTFLGPYPAQPVTGLKLDPASLTAEQRTALARATAACGEHELLVGSAFLAGSDDFAPPGLVQIRGPLRIPPLVAEELAGSGLVKTSYCASPTPPVAA
jgi:hypothetical protein